MVPTFDNDYVEEIIGRLRALSADTKPAWGKLTPGAMIAHLTKSLRYSMGKLGTIPNRASWFTRNVVGPLVLNGIMRMPKNVRTATELLPAAPSTGNGDLETLHAVLEEYLNLVQADELQPQPHFLFGDIGVDGWAKLHAVHLEHHLRQFGV